MRQIQCAYLSGNVALETRLLLRGRFLHKFGMEMMLVIWAAISCLIAVSWSVIRPLPVQEPLFRCELASVCVGCDIVQADHAPDGGVAQGIFHGILVRHHGRNQEEVEEELEQEVKGQEVDAQTTTCTCMDGMR